MSDSIKTHQNPPSLQGIVQAWYCYPEEIATWPYYRKSDNTYTEDFTMASNQIFKRLDSDYPAYQYQEVHKIDANGSYKEQTIIGFTHNSFKDQTNIYQSLLNKQVIILFKLPDGTFRVLGNALQGAKLIVNTDSETVGANNAPGENYKAVFNHRIPCPYYEGTVTIDSNGDLAPYFIEPPLLEAADVPNITTGLALVKLYSTYSGYCMKVRRSSDNALADIGFGTDGLIDSVALFAHVGVSHDGFVHTWYDQGPNGYDFVQTTNGNQPRICSLGVIDTNPVTGVNSIWFGSGKELNCAAYVEPVDECIMLAFGNTSITSESGWITSNWSSSNDVVSIQLYYTSLYLRGVNASSTITSPNNGYTFQTVIWEVDGAANGIFNVYLDGDTVVAPNVAPYNTHINAKSAVTTAKIINFTNTHVTAIVAMNQKSLTAAMRNRFKTAYL